MDQAAKIIAQITTDEIAATRAADDHRQRLATAVRLGLRAEARLVAAQAREYGSAVAKRLAAKRGRDRAQIVAATLAYGEPGFHEQLLAKELYLNNLDPDRRGRDIDGRWYPHWERLELAQRQQWIACARRLYEGAQVRS